MPNTIPWIEVPATDLKRASTFYKALFATDEEIPDSGMDSYTFLPGGLGGITQSDDYKPGSLGPIVYFSVGDDLTPALKRVEPAGGQILQEKTAIGGDMGFYALFLDTEGNRLGLFSQS